MSLKEIRRGNPLFEVCPICGHKGWCATVEGDDGELYIVCKRDTYKCDTNGFTYIKDSNKEGNSIFVFGSREQRGENWKPQPPIITKPKNEIKRFSDKKLNTLNRHLLNKLILENYHREKLNKDGITDEMIKRFNIKSFPVSDKIRREQNITTNNPKRWELAKELFENYGNLTGFPGAYLIERNDKQYWSLAGGNGILFPITNVYGEIVGHQVRYDNPPKSGGKYRWISSAGEYYKNGSSPGNRIGVYYPSTIGDCYICFLTEGVKKAIVVAEKLGYPCISIQGVNSWSELVDVNEKSEKVFDVLRSKYGVQMFIVALDNDKYTNMKVMEQQSRIVNTLKEAGFGVGVAEWDSYMGKGIDDCVVNGYKPMYQLM